VIHTQWALPRSRVDGWRVEDLPPARGRLEAFWRDRQAVGLKILLMLACFAAAALLEVPR
jgi:hypothetical protein